MFAAGPLAALALPWLQRLGLVADTPLWILVGLLAACCAANALFFMLEPRVSPAVAVQLRTGVAAVSTSWFVYATGWGSLIVIGYAIGIADALRTHGSRAWRPGLYWSAIAIAGGESAVALGIAPSVLRPGVGHGVAIATFGCLVIIARTLGSWAETTESATARVEAGRAYFRDLVQHAADVIALVNADLVIAYVSPAIEPLLGRTAEACIGRSVAEVLGEAAGADVARARASLATAAVVTCEWELANDGGERRRALARLTRRHDDSLVLNLRDVTEQRALEEQLERRARIDALTGLPNRAALTQELIGRGSVEGVTLLFIDLDGFKEVNDSLGHERGDKVLREVAQCIAAQMPAGVPVGRLGGDEFLAIVPGADPASSRRLARRIIKAVEATGTNRTPFPLSASVGIATGAPGETADELLHRADQAMYRAKGSGPGRSFTARGAAG